MCSAEKWDDAEAELKSLIGRGELADDAAREFRMRILMGQERYRDVIQACGPTAKHGDWVRIAVAYAKLGDTDQAREWAGRALEAHLPYAEVAMASALEAQGDLGRALDYAERSRLPDTEGRHSRAIARLLGALGEDGEAKVVWRRALTQSPFLDAEYLERFADCCDRLGRGHDAARARRLAAKARDG